MEEAEIAEALKSNNESSLGAESLLRRKEIQEKEQKILAKKKMKKMRAATRFMGLEADLGSDNEDNDDVIKRIDRNDLEENENDLDNSLDSFVDNEAPEGDDEEIAAAE